MTAPEIEPAPEDVAALCSLPPPPLGRARFAVLGAYCAASFLCGGAWNTLAPIYGVAQERFQVGPSAVTLVALSLFLTYVPGSVLALFVTERHGLRVTLLLGACMQTGMSLFKWIGVALCPAPHGAFALLLVGQVLGGLGQPLILNVVARLTMDWCEAERFACASAPALLPPAPAAPATLAGWPAAGAMRSRLHA
jgi:FLVCR family MFS transporter 7